MCDVTTWPMCAECGRELMPSPTGMICPEGHGKKHPRLKGCTKAAYLVRKFAADFPEAKLIGRDLGFRRRLLYTIDEQEGQWVKLFVDGTTNRDGFPSRVWPQLTRTSDAAKGMLAHVTNGMFARLVDGVATRVGYFVPYVAPGMTRQQAVDFVYQLEKGCPIGDRIILERLSGRTWNFERGGHNADNG